MHPRTTVACVLASLGGAMLWHWYNGTRADRADVVGLGYAEAAALHKRCSHHTIVVVRAGDVHHAPAAPDTVYFLIGDNDEVSRVVVGGPLAHGGVVASYLL